MKYELYRFFDSLVKDAQERYVIIEVRGEDTDSTMRRIEEYGLLDTETRGVLLDKQFETMEPIHRTPTMVECGTTDALYFRYRMAALGAPATFFDFYEARRIHMFDQEHVLRVVEYAHKQGILDNLYEGLSRLACRDDQTVMLSRDGEFSFGFFIVSIAEYKQAVEGAVRRTELTISMKNRYHGGLILHDDRCRGGEARWTTHT